MIKIHLLVLLMLFAFGCQKKQDTSSNTDVLANDEKLLRYLKEAEWPKAYAEQDTLLLDRILDESFVMIDQNGNWYTKKDELAWIKEHATQNDSFRYEIKRLDILPNGTAIICGTGHIVDDSVTSVYQSSNIFVKKNDVWKAIQSHVSGVKEIE